MPTTPALPRLPSKVLRALLPLAERDEVLADVAMEFSERSQRDGSAAARRWVWRQVASSVPALLRRCAWRGMTGFEPRANRMRPGGPRMESWIIDLRYSLRRLRTRPLYAALAVLTLALGVGGAAAITGIVRGLLVKPLPYATEQELGVFWSIFDWSESEFLYLRPDFPGFRAVAAYRNEDVTLQSAHGATRLLPGISASAELFDVLGRAPFLGRGFRAGDDRTGSDPVVVLSHGLWQELGGDRAVVGSRVRLDGVERTVVGVMPAGFWFPEPAVRLWLAEPLDPENRSGNYALVGRVAPGMTMESTAPHLARITARLGEGYTYPEQWDKTKNAAVTPIRDHLVGHFRPALLATLGAMAMILLIACANVSALMLGQVEGRATEFAVRAALGAERTRLLQQLVAESLVVGAAAGLVGAAVAVAGFRFLVGALPLGAWGEGATLDWTVFSAAMIAALVASLLVAAVPVVSLWRSGDLRGVLASTRSAGVSGRGGRLESGLVVAEVALAVLMAAGAALLVRSVANLYALDPGLQPAQVAVLDVVMPGDLEPPQRRVLLRELTDALAVLPGVDTAAVTHKLPLRGPGHSTGIVIDGRPELDGTTTFYRIVSPGYFEALGMPLRTGRTFTAADRGAGPPAEGGDMPVVVNEALAARYFAGQDPLGRTIGGTGAREIVIGVVGNAAEGRLTDPPAPARYWLPEHAPWALDAQTLVLRAGPGLDPVALLEPARREVARLAPAVAVREATTMQRVLDEAVGPARQVMVLLTLLAALAVLLGAVGVYGVISHFVSRRRRDWAIRMALGLAPREVVAQVVQKGASLVGLGITLGVTAAVLLARLIDSLLYGVKAGDPLALAAAGAALLVVGLAAALVPAWRAGRTHPGLVLREG